MATSLPRLVFIGYGEAAMAFAEGMTSPAVAYDPKFAAAVGGSARWGVTPAMTNDAAVAGAPLILSLVTPGNALAAARQTAAGIAAGALYCDMNSVAPDTKRAVAGVIEAAGGRYVDVSVMAPVHPGRRAVPLLVSGPHAAAAVAALAGVGFGAARVVDGPVGAAAAVKMIRSVLVKGLEALTTECVLAADRAGVFGEVIASLNQSWPGADWAAKADYNLDRMMVHGVRRAEEMAEVVSTLDALGTGSTMSRATVARQQAIGALGVDPSGTLADKIAAVTGARRKAA